MRESKPLEKICTVCGRKMQWRAHWSKNWDQVKYCGIKCRKMKSQDSSHLEIKILELLNHRSALSTICPSEILPEDKKSNPAEMEKVRQAARRLTHQGKIQILQKGQVVDPSEFKGPIRLRLIRGKE